mmetsp:Transcript_25343/g.57743  ORF Transcript_25343/g.57743 Transcript_25343/m.57743 type:complete len:143 (-) Transcript_25343:1602-2030(-)
MRARNGWSGTVSPIPCWKSASASKRESSSMARRMVHSARMHGLILRVGLVPGRIADRDRYAYARARWEVLSFSVERMARMPCVSSGELPTIQGFGTYHQCNTLRGSVFRKYAPVLQKEAFGRGHPLAFAYTFACTTWEFDNS